LVALLPHRPPFRFGDAVDAITVAEQGDRARLRQRLELDHAGHDRVAGEVAGEEELVAGDEPSGLDVLRDRDHVDRVHEAERWPMRQQGDQRVGLEK